MNDTACFENRELSWLKFNERVLEEAEDDRVPLCERLSFLSIFQSNLDEFFMVRIGSLHDQRLVDAKARENKTNMTAGEQIEAALASARDLCHRRDRVYAGLMEQLGEQGVSLVDFRNISAKSEKRLNKQFRKDFLPYLSAMIVGKKQAFPFLPNKEIYAVGVLATKQDKERIGLVHCSSTAFPRLIEIPEQPGSYMLAEELILHYLPLMFPGYVVTSKTLARITRNADIDADAIYDDEELSYREHMAEVVKRRTRLCPVRLELSRSLEPVVIERLCRQLKLDQKQIYSYDAPLDLSFFGEIRDTLRSRVQLFYPASRPQDSAQVDMSRSVLEQIAAKDILLHFPYESVRPFLQMLHEAANDRYVTSICMTLYRLAPHSKVVEALAEAAENGKRVDVLVELKARFDEENNIEWSRRLEEAGCHVIYGVEHLKVHSKLCLIKRETPDGIRYITQIGTGNYNEKTSRLYTDLSYLTARPEIGLEAERVFEALLRAETVHETEYLLVAPNCLQNKLLAMIDEQIARVRQGLKGHIRVKINSMSDKALMNRLIEAGQAGVQVEMIIRGINCLRSSIPGRTNNIRIISVVGQYLEHSRIYIFGDGAEAKYYIGSADWMTRNTLRRVEIACPIVDPSLTDRLETIFRVMWEDNCSVREQGADGLYRRRYPGTEKPLRCQRWLMENAVREAENARNTGGKAGD
ncbi:MAG: polyphosphate kinase 1 [Clostridia bacterium]|nr:polyphosphate kinase 1 [Clostridia bacterium]